MRLSHLILPALLGVLLVGCGPDEDERIDTAPPPATDPVQPVPPSEPSPPVSPTPPPTTPSGVPEESDLNTNPAQD